VLVSRHDRGRATSIGGRPVDPGGRRGGSDGHRSHVLRRCRSQRPAEERAPHEAPTPPSSELCTYPKPVIAATNGLVAAADIVLSVQSAYFAFTLQEEVT
jgi:hypothetical protein